MLTLRPATVADAPAIDAIYNPYVRTSTCTWQHEPDAPAARGAWIDAHVGPHPAIVAVRAGTIVGFGSLSAFRARWGYRMTVEVSVYVHGDHHRHGIGHRLGADLIARARDLGHHAVIAGCSADQHASIALHERLGYREVARLAQVGHNFGRWLDLVFLQLLL